MKGEERRESNEGEKDSDEKNHPLSREGWIMVLSSEINNWMVLFMMVGVLTASSLLVIIGIMVKILGSALSYLFIIFGLYLCLCFFIGYHWFQKRVKPLINTREDIISDESIDFIEVGRRWKEYIKESYGKLLEKSEMDEEEKQSKGEKDDSKEKDLGKNNKKQKEVLQVPQTDIQDIKERMQEIKDMMEGTKLFNLFCVVGSLFVAVGLAIIFATTGYVFHLGIQTLPKYYFFLPLIGGFFILFAGVLMIFGAFYEWADLRKYSDKFVIKFLEELWHTKRWLFVVFFFLICAILDALYLVVLTWFTRISF